MDMGIDRDIEVHCVRFQIVFYFLFLYLLSIFSGNCRFLRSGHEGFHHSLYFIWDSARWFYVVLRSGK